MSRQVIEGSWEELTAHAHELRGHRVRVTILDDAIETAIAGPPKPANALAECIARMEETHGHSAGKRWTREELYTDESLHRH